MLVGEFPGLNHPNRRMIRAPINPMDKSTIVSILPKKISERKCTLQPGIFEIQPGTFDKPAILVVGTSSWWREVGDHEPLLEIPNSAIAVAKSVVDDYCNGLLGCNMGNQMPGLFYLAGDLSVAKLKAEHMPLLINARENQKRWFLELVKMADILWSRSNGNPLAINEDSRLAAKELNLNKPWMGDQQTVELVRCIACGNLRNPAYPVCAVCKAVADPELAAKLNLKFVQ